MIEQSSAERLTRRSADASRFASTSCPTKTACGCSSSSAATHVSTMKVATQDSTIKVATQGQQLKF